MEKEFEESQMRKDLLAARDNKGTDAQHELFKITLMAQVLSHKNQRQLISLISEDSDKLFYEVKKQGVPFLNWNDWIKNYIETSLARQQEIKENRISNLIKSGYEKMMHSIGFNSK